MTGNKERKIKKMINQKESINRLQFQRRKTTLIFTFAFISILVLSPILAVVKAQVIEQKTDAWISVNPNPVGVGQELQVNIWISPYPPSAYLDVHGFMTTITKPDGTTEKVGPVDAYKTSSSYFLYYPDMVGTYTFKLDYPGEEYNDGALVYLPSTHTTTVIVQDDPIPLWPETPFTYDYWERPLSAEHRNWFGVTGSWLNNDDRVNEWCTDIKTPHVMWKTQIDIGGVVGGEMGVSNFYEGSAYEAKAGRSIMIGGYYFNSDFRIGQRTTGGTKCYNLRTGEEIW